MLLQYRGQIPEKFLIVNLYGDEGDIADGLMMGLRRALEAEGLEYLLPSSAFDAALSRIQDIEKNYSDSFAILKTEVEQNGMSVEELRTRLQEYQKNAFDLFRKIHPFFSAGGRFAYTTMLSPNDFYTSVVKELREKHGFSGIAVFWDEFGHKMGEVVKDPTGKEGLVLQEFAECCNASENNQLHFCLVIHNIYTNMVYVRFKLFGVQYNCKHRRSHCKQHCYRFFESRGCARIEADDRSTGPRSITRSQPSYQLSKSNLLILPTSAFSSKVHHCALGK